MRAIYLRLLQNSEIAWGLVIPSIDLVIYEEDKETL